MLDGSASCQPEIYININQTRLALNEEYILFRSKYISQKRSDVLAGEAEQCVSSLGTVLV